MYLIYSGSSETGEVYFVLNNNLAFEEINLVNMSNIQPCNLTLSENKSGEKLYFTDFRGYYLNVYDTLKFEPEKNFRSVYLLVPDGYTFTTNDIRGRGWIYVNGKPLIKLINEFFNPKFSLLLDWNFEEQRVIVS